jgi:hypothetical protein
MHLFSKKSHINDIEASKCDLVFDSVILSDFSIIGKNLIETV